VDDAGRHTDEAACGEFGRLVAEAHGQLAIEYVEHVVEVLVDMGWRSRKARRHHHLAQVEGTVGLFARGLDRDGARTADLLALTGRVNRRLHRSLL
jgi:hypothetical protein